MPHLPELSGRFDLEFGEVFGLTTLLRLLSKLLAEEAFFMLSSFPPSCHEGATVSKTDRAPRGQARRCITPTATPPCWAHFPKSGLCLLRLCPATAGEVPLSVHKGRSRRLVLKCPQGSVLQQ